MKKGWETKTLGEVCQLVSGQHIDAKDYNTASRGVGYLTGPSDFGPVNPLVSKWTEHPKVKAKRGDILITVKGSGVGKINLLDQDEVAISRQLMAVRVREADPRFIYAFLSSTFDHFQAQSTGAAIPGISREQVLGLRIAVPPLPDQRRIVGILDKAFEGIATAKANAEKNLQNARDLFESHLQSVFTHRGEGWVEKPLEIVSTILNGYSFKSADFTSKEGVKCIKITNVGVKEFVCESDGFLPNDFATEYRTVSVKKGSIVLALTRTIISGGLKVAVVPDEYDGALLNQRVASIVPNAELLSSRFLFAYLSTQTVADYVTERVNTLMQPNLSIKDLKAMPIPVLPLREQEQIADQLSVLRDETRRLESVYQQKRAALEELKKSLLHQAFTGGLCHYEELLSRHARAEEHFRR
jgi:type I restriction enzyme, S subunit